MAECVLEDADANGFGEELCNSCSLPLRIASLVQRDAELGASLPHRRVLRVSRGDVEEHQREAAASLLLGPVFEFYRFVLCIRSERDSRVDNVVGDIPILLYRQYI